MHYIYKVKNLGDSKWKFEQEKQVDLFGRVNGIDCQILQRELTEQSVEAPRWQIDMRNGLDKMGWHNSALLINFKPNSADGNLSLYELVKVWGYSEKDWTPVLLYFRGLLVDENMRDWEEKKFTRDLNEVKKHDPIFSFNYKHGTISGRELKGRWTGSGPSSASSVLLWPNHYEYFDEVARQILDEKR